MSALAGSGNPRLRQLLRAPMQTIEDFVKLQTEHDQRVAEQRARKPGSDNDEVSETGHINQVGDFIPGGGIRVDPWGRVLAFPDRHVELQREVKHRWPFLNLGFDVEARQWCWYRISNEVQGNIVGQGALTSVGHVQEVVTIIQGICHRRFDDRGAPIYTYKHPGSDDIALLEFIEENHPEQFDPTPGGRWISRAARRLKLKEEIKSAKRRQEWAYGLVEEWAGFIDPKDPGRFRPSIVVPGGVAFR